MDPKKDKFRRTLNHLVDSGQFIPGIYNFCDRWCERCTMSHKCLTYAHEKEMWSECNDSGNNDIDLEKFWEQIRLSFEVVLDMISEEARRFNIDLEEVPEEPVPEVAKNPVEELACSYGISMGHWLIKNDEVLKAKSSRLIYSSSDNERAVKFADAVEVVKWYCYFIEGKIYRAFFDLTPKMEEQDDWVDTLADNNGSAKAAIIATVRSIDALLIIYDELKDQEDELLDFLSLLAEIKKQMLLAFPAAMAFKRPGFDDE